MASIIQVVIEGQDNTGPAFASARQHLLALQQATTGAQTGLARIGQTTQQAAAQAGTGLARIEQRAEGAEAAIITLGIAGSTTATRMRSLGIQIQNQNQALTLAERRLVDVRAAHDADSLAVGRAQLAYDRLNRALGNNIARMRDLRTSGDTTGISVIGMGGAGGAGGAAGGMAALGQFQGALGALGLTIGAREMLQYGAAAISASNDLQDTERTVRGLTGTIEGYNQAVSAARANQRLFGGSLQENMASMQGMATAARGAGVNIAEVNRTAQLLSFKAPEQGAIGAMIALNEVLTGEGDASTRSLQMRYELPEKALKAIQAAPDPTAKLQAINDLLADQGITAGVLNERLGQTSQAYRDLGIAADDAKTKAGGRLPGRRAGHHARGAHATELSHGQARVTH
jgi:hypothetical protein